MNNYLNKLNGLFYTDISIIFLYCVQVNDLGLSRLYSIDSHWYTTHDPPSINNLSFTNCLTNKCALIDNSSKMCLSNSKPSLYSDEIYTVKVDNCLGISLENSTA